MFLSFSIQAKLDFYLNDKKIAAFYISKMAAESFGTKLTHPIQQPKNCKTIFTCTNNLKFCLRLLWTHAEVTLGHIETSA